LRSRSRPKSESVPVIALGIADAADCAGISRTTLWRHLRDGTGPKVAEVAGKRVIRVTALDQWLASLEKTRVSPRPKRGAAA
jgi:predicted DNA-binding transcriptional regulator AlpA